MWLLKGEKSVWAQLDLLLRASQAVIKLSTGQQDVFCTERSRKASSVKLSQLAGQIQFFVVVGPRFHC